MLRNDLSAVSGSLDHLAGSHEDRWRNNDLALLKTAATLADLTGSVDTLEEKIGVLETLAPFLHHVNSSTISSIETLRFNITNLGQVAEDLKAGLSNLETRVDASASSASNSTTSLKRLATKIDNKVDKLQSESAEFLTGFAKLVSAT
jgi:chromosome segregation ATPase